jgi:hypothetical protein
MVTNVAATVVVVTAVEERHVRRASRGTSAEHDSHENARKPELHR